MITDASRVLAAAAVLVLTACTAGRLEQERVPPAQLALERWARHPTLPDRILFHRDPASGQWAQRRHGDVVVRWTVREPLAEPPGAAWLVEQRISLPQEGQALRIDLACDAQGRVLRAEGWAEAAGRQGAGPFLLPLAPALPVVAPAGVATLPTGEVVAGLPTHVATEDGFRWWYAADVPFSLDLVADPHGRWGLVQSAWGARANEQLLGQGTALSASAPDG